MARPRKCRRICSMPRVCRFHPEREDETEPVVMSIDELEILRLIDYEMLKQDEAAALMEVARATAQIIYSNARRKCAQALVEGRPLVIKGGDYRLCQESESCPYAICRRKRNRNKEDPMITAFPVEMDRNETDICPVFARTPYFAFLSEDGGVTFKRNPASMTTGGAALKAVQFLLDNGVTTLVTPRLGQNAARALTLAGVTFLKSPVGPLSASIAACKAGTLEKLTTFHAGYSGGRWR